MIYVTAVVVWVGMLVAIATLGAARDMLLTAWLGELPAHQIGTVAACVVVLAFSYCFVRAFAPSRGEALAVGALWLGLALAFEFLFFHFGSGIPWSVLLADYHVSEGRLLILLWVTTLLGPYATLRFVNHRRGHLRRSGNVGRAVKGHRSGPRG